MKILYLVNKNGPNGYYNKMSRVRFHGMESIGEISDLTWWGPGWEGYDNTISVSDNLEKLENWTVRVKMGKAPSDTIPHEISHYVFKVMDSLQKHFKMMN